MYLKPFKNFTYSVVSEQDKLSAVKKANMVDGMDCLHDEVL